MCCFDLKKKKVPRENVILSLYLFLLEIWKMKIEN